MNKPLKILLFTDALVSLGGAMFGPIYAIYVQKIGGDLLTAASAWAVFSIVSGVCIYSIGKFEDKIKETELAVVLGFLIGGLGYFLYIFVSTTVGLFLVQIVLGLAVAIATPAYDAVFSRHLEKGKYASNWGSWEAMTYIVSGIGALVGGFLVTYFSFQLLFGVIAILNLVSALYIYFLPRKVL